MPDATIVCPHCHTPLQLTESLERQVSSQVEAKLRDERARLIADEARKARLAAAADVDAKAREIAQLHDVLKARDAKLAEAQQAQADWLRKQRQLDDAIREQQLAVEKRVQQSLAEERTKAKREAEEALKLKVLEKDQQIASMQGKIEELRKKAEQGSQQLQGEVQEVNLERSLRVAFPIDNVCPVPKGQHGGDILHGVTSANGQACGTILWESKRTKSWSDGWLTKLRDDARAARAELCVVVSQVLPKSVDTFGVIDGVWVTTPKTAIALALALRQTLLEVATARCLSQGQATKKELVYDYLTGPRFRQRVEAIVEAFTTMREDLDKERRVMERQWAKREEQLGRFMKATVGMYGDLQGIAGQSLQELDGLDTMETPKLVAPSNH